MKHLAALAIVLALAGCGGSTSVSPTHTVRTFQPGYQWDYIISGTIADGTQTEVNPVNGTASFIMTPETVETPSQETARVMLANRQVVGTNFAEVTAERLYIMQDADGTIWICGGENDGGEYWFGEEDYDERYKFIQSPLESDTSWRTHVKSSLGPVYDDYYIVTGTAKVNVPAGGFDTYRVTCNGMHSGTSFVADYWWAANVGMYVQATEKTTRTDGLILTLTHKLAQAAY